MWGGFKAILTLTESGSLGASLRQLQEGHCSNTPGLLANVMPRCGDEGLLVDETPK